MVYLIIFFFVNYSFGMKESLYEEQGFPLFFTTQTIFSSLFNTQVNYQKAKLYAQADSENLFASMAEINDLSFGTATILPVKLYIKNALWQPFNRFHVVPSQKNSLLNIVQFLNIYFHNK